MRGAGKCSAVEHYARRVEDHVRSRQRRTPQGQRCAKACEGLVSSGGCTSNSQQLRRGIPCGCPGVGQSKTTVPGNNAGGPTFSYVGVPASSCMNDWYEIASRPRISSFQRKLESSRGRGRLNRIVRQSGRIAVFIPWRAGLSRHERLLRKYVPYYDPGSRIRCVDGQHERPA